MQHGFLDKYSDRHSLIHRLDPRTKFLSLLLYVILVVTTPAESYWRFAAYAVVIVTAVALSRIPLFYVFKRSSLIIPFGLLTAAFLPFWQSSTAVKADDIVLWSQSIDRHGLLILWNVVIKSWLAAVAMILLASSTPFPRLVMGLQSLRVPQVLLMILSFMYRYIFVVTDEAMRMERARTCRYFGGAPWRQVRVLSGLIGLLFVRTYERGERVYFSMVSRGFDGRIRTLSRLTLAPVDVSLGLTFAACLLLIRIWKPPA